MTIILDPKGSIWHRNPIEIRCICTKKLLVIGCNEPKEDCSPNLQIACQKIELTCFCGKVHTIENNIPEVKE